MRIQKLLAHLPKNCILLLSKPADMFYYAHFSGEGYVVLSAELRCIYTDGRYTEQAQRETADFAVLDIRKLWDDLRKSAKTVYFQTEHLNFKTYAGARKLGVDMVPSDIPFAELRAVKDEKETEALQKAAAIAEKAYADTLAFICSGKTEKEIAAYLNYKMACYGGEKPSFETICISGRNTALPHGVPSDKAVQDGELITLDFGTVYQGYCSDMTRTVALGYLSDEMEWVYDIVLRAQDETERAIKPGVTARDIDAVARKIIVDNNYGAYFLHSTGHGVGLEIHEFPNLAPKNEAVLQKNQVVTVEPGIYLAGKFGVRIENTVILTENGCNSLQKCAKELIIL